jgi:hypothetical protein
MPNTNRADLIAAAAVIVWDELPGAHVSALLCVDEICRKITHVQKPFGGIPFVGIGDFRQVAPVVKGQGQTATSLGSVKSSTLWRHFVVLSLHSPIRSAADPAFTHFVDSIGEDTIHNTTSLDLFETVANEEEAIQFLYPPDIIEDPFACLQRAFLSPRNCFVDEFNDQMLKLLSGNECKCSIHLCVLSNLR